MAENFIARMVHLFYQPASSLGGAALTRLEREPSRIFFLKQSRVKAKESFLKNFIFWLETNWQAETSLLCADRYQRTDRVEGPT
jgi:hypothetical protein